MVEYDPTLPGAWRLALEMQKVLDRSPHREAAAQFWSRRKPKPV